MRVWKFGDNIDTDAIIPGRYLVHYDPAILASHAFEGIRDDFAKNVREGDIVVAGRNFGCGSSREHAPIALFGGGVRIIIAQSFARIFYRNAINVGILPLICPYTGKFNDGDHIAIDLPRHSVEFNGISYPFEPVPQFLAQIVKSGGLVEYAKDFSMVPTCIG